MNLLDTDVLSHLQKADTVGAAIVVAMAASPDQDYRITTVNAWEMLDGALGLIQQLRKQRRALIPGLRLLQDLLDCLSLWQGRILRYDDATEAIHRGLPARLRQELENDARIAAVALTQGAAVWTCNVDDYKRVPGLTVYAAETGVRAA